MNSSFPLIPPPPPPPMPSNMFSLSSEEEDTSTESLPDNILTVEMMPYGVNHGISWSLYCHDPEGNRIEMFIDSPFYVGQPSVNELDLSMSDAEILQITRDKFSDDLSFKFRTDWSKELAERL